MVRGLRGGGGAGGNNFVSVGRDLSREPLGKGGGGHGDPLLSPMDDFSSLAKVATSISLPL